VAKKSYSQPPNEREKLMFSKTDAKARLEKQITKGEELSQRNIQNEQALQDVREEYYRWDTYNGNLLKSMFNTEQRCREYHFGIGGMADHSTLAEGIKWLHRDIKYAISKVTNVLDAIELIEESDNLPTSKGKSREMPNKLGDEISKRVFVVHGHDDAAKQEAARLLMQLDLEPIILSEQENEGRTIIEKFEHYSDVGFAVVLLTPDDVGETARRFQEGGESSLVKRARQNVVFEMGFFYGRLGRQRVCALLKGDTERPSDISGIVYTFMDSSSAWRFELAKEMKAAGLPIDMNKL
jgi:predicted nucleotide-binding protein